MSATTTVTTAIEELFLQSPEENTERVLHATQVIGVDGNRCTVVPAEPLADVSSGDGIRVFFSSPGRKFFRQLALVRDILDNGTMELQFVGQPVGADQRLWYRVSCIGSKVTATLDHEVGCTVVDVSATGFGLRATQSLRIGDVRPAKVHYNGDTYEGRITIQSVRHLSADEIRYGVGAVDGTELHRALPRLSTAIQREQLRRIS